jgi:hypothetical protein
MPPRVIQNEVPEGAILMVVLAVHVGGNRPADGHEFGPRRHRQEEPTGQKIAKDFSQAYARFTLQHTALRVESEKPVEPRVTDDSAVRVEWRVAVAASHAVRYQGRLGTGLQDGRQLAPAVGAIDITRLDRKTPPPGEWLSYEVVCHCRLSIADFRLLVAYVHP